MGANGKLKVGMYWASSCGGCDISLLEIGPRILDLIKVADVVFWPCAADFKYQTVAGGTVPPRNAALRVGCADKVVCDECLREKKLRKIPQFTRGHLKRPEPGWCLLEQGILCMGPATRSGCGALCLKADLRCEGCYGPPANVEDQGTAMIGALGALLDATTKERAHALADQLADPTGTFYRFSVSSSMLKVRK